MTARLRFTFKADGDGTGELTGEVESGDFSGKGSAWLHVRELIEFAEKLFTHPKPDFSNAHIQGGFWHEKEKQIKQEHLFVSVYAVAVRGEVGVKVRLADQIHECDRADSRHAVEVELLTHYESLSRFGNDLRELANGKTKEAILYADA